MSEEWGFAAPRGVGSETCWWRAAWFSPAVPGAGFLHQHGAARPARLARTARSEGSTRVTPARGVLRAKGSAAAEPHVPPIPDPPRWLGAAACPGQP